jgi:hypothetical protein
VLIIRGRDGRIGEMGGMGGGAGGNSRFRDRLPPR